MVPCSVVRRRDYRFPRCICRSVVSPPESLGGDTTENASAALVASRHRGALRIDVLFLGNACVQPIRTVRCAVFRLPRLVSGFNITGRVVSRGWIGFLIPNTKVGLFTHHAHTLLQFVSRRCEPTTAGPQRRQGLFPVLPRRKPVAPTHSGSHVQRFNMPRPEPGL